MIKPLSKRPIEEFIFRVRLKNLEGLKENVIVGHKIPAGTGMRDYQTMIVGSKTDYDNLVAKKNEAVESETTIGSVNS